MVTETGTDAEFGTEGIYLVGKSLKQVRLQTKQIPEMPPV